MQAAAIDSKAFRALDASLYVRHRSTLAGQLRRMDGRLYGARQDVAEVVLPEEIRQHWFAEWRTRVGYGPRGDFDNSILVTAKKGKGQGKSAAVMDAAFECDRRFMPEWRSKVTFSPADFLDAVNSQSRGEWAILDEAGDSMLKTEFWSEASRKMTKAMIISRDSHVTAVMCIPTVALFNSAVMNSLVDYWWRVEYRGLLFVHPRPDERYTKSRGIGWFPDPEWGRYTWPAPTTWAPERLAIWREYRRLRRQFRKESLGSTANEIRSGAPIASSAERYACEVCGSTFQRRDQMRRHLGTAKHLERIAGAGAPGTADPGPASAP